MHHSTCHHVAYRLTCADYEALWVYAEGRCQICKITADQVPGGKLYIDHDGRYGYHAARGLLCSKCNSLMRYVDRGQKHDRRAIDYLHNAWFVRLLRSRDPGAKMPKRPSEEGVT